ncbi:iron-sulfur cluster assembly scaffold protein [Pontiellaceae bacterium B12227]|nr:iron-sulfur cluster assembly scaffold protein [Pontiellaceae bacterium B12227]
MYENAIAAIEARAKRFGPMRDANGYAKVHGECDDIVEIWLRIDGGKIRSGSFMTNGCGFSKHCCNMALQLAEGMTPDEAKGMTQAQVLEVTGPLPEDHEHCALLAADTIGLAVEHYLNPPPKIPLSEKLKQLLSREPTDA